MDIEYGCYVSNRYDDFLNVSENESHCRNDAIIANGKQKNKSKQRKKKNNAKRNRARENNNASAIETVNETNETNENENIDDGAAAVSGELVTEKPLEIAVNQSPSPTKEIVTEMVVPATIDTIEQVQSNVPIVEPINDAIADDAAAAEVKWSQICIEEDKAIAERNKIYNENGERRVYSTIFIYNSNFGNGNRFVRSGDHFRYRRPYGMRNFAKDRVTEKSESEHTESINDSNNNDVGEMENGNMNHPVNTVPKKRKNTKNKHRNRAAKEGKATEEPIQLDALPNGNAMPESGDMVTNGHVVPNGDTIPNGERKIPIRKRRNNNKLRRMHKSNSIEKQTQQQQQQHEQNNGEILMEQQHNGTSVGNSCSGDHHHQDASSHANNKNHSSAANSDDNHMQAAAKTTDAENVNKSKRSRFSRCKQNAFAQKIEWRRTAKRKEEKKSKAKQKQFSYFIYLIFFFCRNFNRFFSSDNKNRKSKH